MIFVRVVFEREASHKRSSIFLIDQGGNKYYHSSRVMGEMDMQRKG